jgi:hypothetical protein
MPLYPPNKGMSVRLARLPRRLHALRVILADRRLRPLSLPSPSHTLHGPAPQLDVIARELKVLALVHFRLSSYPVLVPIACFTPAPLPCCLAALPVTSFAHGSSVLARWP